MTDWGLSSSRRKRKRQLKIRMAISILVFGMLVAVLTGIHYKNMPKITVKVKSQSMFQEEEIPVVQASVQLEGKKKVVLDKKSKYTVQDFVDDLKQGKGYRLKYEIDGKKEGKFPVSVVLDKKIKKNLEGKWNGKIKFSTEDGTLKVKNKYGTWEKDKFKRRDGTYVTSDFITSKGQTYYFDESGKKTTGWQKINGFQYFFDKAGKMQTGWKKDKKEKYYLQEDGKMAVGWLDIKKDSYYFDKNGKMVTGKKVIGKKKCVFRKDGTLKSKEKKVDPEKPMIALTFDDGPGKHTDALLNQLDQYDARATFFMVGKNAVKYPEVIQKMEKIGCELGNHSTTHANLVKLDDAGIRREIDTAQSAIAEAVGYGGYLLRPPYGETDERVQSIADLPFVMWSLDTKDWKKKDAAKIIEYVLTYVGDGDIVLMHDIHDFSVEAARNLIPQLIERGYQLVTVSELAEARGTNLVNGEKYSQFYTD